MKRRAGIGLAACLCWFAGLLLGCGSGDGGKTSGEDAVALGFGLVCSGTGPECLKTADYCVPDEPGVAYAGLVPLTCTRKDCEPGVSASCPAGYRCKIIPDFVVGMMKGKGVAMPGSLCAQ